MKARDIIRGLALWPGTPRVDPIRAGYTNENFRVLAGGQTYFARAAGDLPHHGISRRNEALCAGIAAEAGIAPEILHAREGVLVTRFIEGRTLKMGEAPPEATLAELGRLLADVHRLPARPELVAVDLVAACRRYLSLPGSDQLGTGDRKRIEDLLGKVPAPSRECFVHGDAFPENFIDDGRRLWLVDWEYAGQGNPAQDLAYLAMNLDLPESGIRALVEAHGGSIAPDEVRALVPLAAARDVLWCLAEIEARGQTRKLASYAWECHHRLSRLL
jgi:aminoglycoside phosphotransferase (APT) family kinase protein